jgi:signal transduction histidine kinase
MPAVGEESKCVVEVLAKLRETELGVQRNCLYAAVMQSPMPIGVVRAPGMAVEFANKAYLELLERGLGWRRDWLAMALGSGEPIVEPELRLRNGGREPDSYWCVTHSPFRGPSGSVEGVLIMCQDVTALVVERKRADASAAELGLTLKDALSTVRRIETFLAMVAHDLRNPLAAIVVGAEGALVQLRGGADEDVYACLRRIVKTGRRMHVMIEQLLDFTRIGMGRGLPLQRHAADLQELAQQAVAELEERYPRRVRVESVGDVAGDWDGNRLLEVFSNLIANALDHGSPDTPVRLVLDGRGPDNVEVSVHNEGAIARGELPTLFDAFRRGSPGRHRAEGLGLGLFITKQIVMAHGGVIRVESSRRGGTRFVVRLPRRHPPAPGRR